VVRAQTLPSGRGADLVGGAHEVAAAVYLDALASEVAGRVGDEVADDVGDVLGWSAAEGACGVERADIGDAGGRAARRLPISVSTRPGATMLTWMLCFALFRRA
jgi:hypothetical protein